jgi:predicted porin
MQMPYICSMQLLIALSLMALSTHAAGQSEIVLYGNIDLGIAVENNSSARIDRGYNNWIGFSGEENLGTGFSAIFNVQARFNPDTGQQERPSTFFQGETTVGLRSASAGTVRLGRALSPLWANVWAYEPWLNSGFNASLSAYQTGSYSSDGVNDVALDFANFSRISNAVFYRTPEFSGLTVDVASEIEEASNADTRVMGTSVNYARGPFAAMLSYERNASRDDIFFLGASYRIGSTTIMGSYSENDQVNVGRERVYLVAGTYTSNAHMVRGGYGRNRETESDKLSVGYVYNLSKRTSIYADLYRERTTDNRDGAALGMNHTF